jgi:hypothetical protein
MWGRRGVDNGLVVSKDVALFSNRNAKITKSHSEVDDLIIVVLTAMNSEPKVAVSTVACFFKYQSIGV